MDTLDTRIFRALVQDRTAFSSSEAKPSFKSIAGRLGVDEDTVRNRIRKMQESGFLQHFSIMMNPTVVGLNATQVLVEVSMPKEKQDLVDQLKKLPGSLVIVDCYGGSLSYAFLHRDETSRDRQLGLVRSLSRTTNLISTPVPFTACTLKLMETDWKIVRSLRNDPRKAYNSVAKEVKISTRTVKRRLGRMTESKAIFIVPSLNPAAMQGMIQADLLVLYDDARSKTELDRKFLSTWDDYVARAETGSPGSSFFNLFIKNISQADEVLDWVRDQPGVSSSRVDLIKNRYELYDTLDREQETEMKRLFPATSSRR